MAGRWNGLPCGQTKTNPHASKMLRTIRWVSGAHTQRALSQARLSWTFTIWDRIAKTARSREELHMRFAKQSAGEYRGLSPANTPAGISTMRHYGSLAASERQTSAPGPSRRRRATG